METAFGSNLITSIFLNEKTGKSIFTTSGGRALGYVMDSHVAECLLYDMHDILVDPSEYSDLHLAELVSLYSRYSYEEGGLVNSNNRDYCRDVLKSNYAF